MSTVAKERIHLSGLDRMPLDGDARPMLNGHGGIQTMITAA